MFNSKRITKIILILILFLTGIFVYSQTKKIPKKSIEYAYVIMVNRYIVDEKQESELKKELLKLVEKYNVQLKEMPLE